MRLSAIPPFSLLKSVTIYTYIKQSKLFIVYVRIYSSLQNQQSVSKKNVSSFYKIVKIQGSFVAQPRL